MYLAKVNATKNRQTHIGTTDYNTPDFGQALTVLQNAIQWCGHSTIGDHPTYFTTSGP